MLPDLRDITRESNPVERAIFERSRTLSVVRPKECLGHPEETARIILEILAANYGTHNLTRNVADLTRSVEKGEIMPFLGVDQSGEVVSCAALIRLNETDVELGRGACFPRKAGGAALPLLVAFQEWKKGAAFPDSQILRVEVRTAKPTKEVPGGIATQSICLKTIGFTPTAIAPLFHHGIPDRQEMFILAHHFRQPLNAINMNRPRIPIGIFNDSREILLFSSFWERFSGFKPDFVSVENVAFSTPFVATSAGPFLVLDQKEGSEPFNPQVIDDAFGRGIRFAIVKLPLNQDRSILMGKTTFLRSLGFRIFGFEPEVLNNKVSVNFLMGRLSGEGSAKLIAPCFTEGVFDHQFEDLLTLNFLKWRGAGRGDGND